ncbi:hypothetical protein [Streptomyces triticirhizae]|uniref:Uncharacterized protein n=1 Tax=Streptomyces triticirhizae TaxID=2483353 RepID=A0A3M2KY62_9ACTN|nr:hypothetical protein [Streptomyces triticirhizae]RMI30449.1 hypothetical protein EBN88_26750 [Streptomyces triticirhizae]
MGHSDLYLSYDEPRTNRDNIRNIANLMEQPCEAMAEVDGAAMGVSRLERRMDDFGNEWEYGISQLAEFADQAANGLDEILRAFQSVDDGLAQGLEDEGTGNGEGYIAT